MCDCRGGSILVSIPKQPEGPFGREVLFGAFPERVTMLQDIATTGGAEVLERASFEFAQVDVEPGSEQAAIDDFRMKYLFGVQAALGGDEAIRRFTHPDTGPVLQVESLATSSVSAATTAASPGFSFTADHPTFTAALGPRPVAGVTPHVPKVAILDSGWTDPHTGAAPSSQTDLTQGAPQPTAPDGYGHGTVVAEIVHDLVPTAEISVFKIFEDKAAREWHFMAGLVSAAAIGPDVINASVGFGLHDRNCRDCGRDYGTTRSLVFKRIIDLALSHSPDSVFVAAAGNNAASAADYPARFGNTVCVTSSDGVGEISTFANVGALDEDGNPHAAFVCAPGGDRLENGRGRDLFVADWNGRKWRGTSFASAYASAVLADRVARHGRSPHWTTIPALAAAADGASINGYAPQDHGAGAVQWF